MPHKSTITAIKMVQEMNDQPLEIESLGVWNVVRTTERKVILAYWVFSIIASDSFI